MSRRIPVVRDRFGGWMVVAADMVTEEAAKGFPDLAKEENIASDEEADRVISIVAGWLTEHTQWTIVGTRAIRDGVEFTVR